MIDESMQEAESTITEYFEEKKANDKYEKWIRDEEDKVLKSFKFTRTMNLYKKHCRYMGRRHKYIYEDDYHFKLEEKRADLYELEII
jgi:hypothetical protein